MKAIQFSEFGGPEVLELVELPDPTPAAGQIRIRVRAVGINPIDSKIRSGAMGGDLPRRTGVECSGVVDELGPGVTDVAVGDEVFASAAGAAAELALSAFYAPIPPSLDFVAAAALPVAVETAVRTLDFLGVGAGQTLLINGGSGNVGTAAIQFARERGARVIGTASADNFEYVRSFGAEPVAYGDGLVERVRELAGGRDPAVDRALDAAGGGVLPALVELTGSREHVVTIVDFPGAQANGVPSSAGSDTNRAGSALTDAVALIQAGRLRIPVAETFPLADIVAAHRVGEAGHPPGKLVVTVP
jgi:NADPH:quinone reductase-like Zn-dependent oxidoreductase